MPLLIATFLLTALLATKPVGRRFLAGHHLDGKRRSDGTFLHRGRNALDISGHVSPWALLAGWERATWRLAALLGPIVFILGLELNALVTLATTATGSTAHPTTATPASPSSCQPHSPAPKTNSNASPP